MRTNNNPPKSPSLPPMSGNASDTSIPVKPPATKSNAENHGLATTDIVSSVDYLSILGLTYNTISPDSEELPPMGEESSMEYSIYGNAIEFFNF